MIVMIIIPFLIYLNFMASYFLYAKYATFKNPENVKVAKVYVYLNEKDEIEQALITTCQFVKAYSFQNSCNKNGWSFAGGINTTISLSDLDALPKSTVLNCSTLESYARYKLFNSISHLNYRLYSIDIKVPDNATDECGIVDFVFK